MSSPNIAFDATRDISDLQGKVIMMTGANTGLGRQTAIELAKHSPAQIWLTARDTGKGKEVADLISRIAPNVEVFMVRLDLTSLASVKTAASAFLGGSKRLDLLYLNAGILGAPPALTEDGFEIHMGVNHVGHALLLHLLTPRLVATAAQGHDVRVVSITSIGYKYAAKDGISMDKLREATGLSPVMRYTQSKLANILYAREISKRFPQFTNVVIHPGEVKTELFSREPGDDQVRHLQQNVAPKQTIAVEEGVKNHLWAGTAKEVSNGVYYEPVGRAEPLVGHAVDAVHAEKFWAWTQQAIADYI